jgi:hypothetical protein
LRNDCAAGAVVSGVGGGDNNAGDDVDEADLGDASDVAGASAAVFGSWIGATPGGGRGGARAGGRAGTTRCDCAVAVNVGLAFVVASMTGDDIAACVANRTLHYNNTKKKT